MHWAVTASGFLLLIAAACQALMRILMEFRALMAQAMFVFIGVPVGTVVVSTVKPDHGCNRMLFTPDALMFQNIIHTHILPIQALAKQ
jgi:hypothetical protein